VAHFFNDRLAELEREYEAVIRELRHEQERNTAIEQAGTTGSDDDLRLLKMCKPGN
jgi:hypothetical protein